MKDLQTGRVYISSQNHGYVVSRANEAICSVTYENANDHTVEGITYRDIPAMSVQFLPDGVEYSQSTKQVYDAFFAMMKGKVE